MLNKKFFLISALFFIVALLMLFAVDEKGYKFLAKFVLFTSLLVPITAVVLQKTIGVSKSKALLANGLLLLVSITIVLVMAEFFVRFLYADITTTADNTSYFALKWKKTNKPSLNSLGFREREISAQKPDDVYRIAVVGDSLTYGQGIAEQDRFSRLIEQKLKGDTIAYQVYNFGIPGAETVDHISFLDDIFKIDPDFILLQWFTNDVEGHDKSARPVPYRLIPSDFLSGFLRRNSALFYLINGQWNALQGQFGLVGSYEDSMNVRFSDVESEDSQRAIQELNDFIARVKHKNIQLGIVMFPNFVHTEGGVEKYPFDFLFGRVLDACQKNDIQCIDLRPEFAVENPKELWVNRFDQHPSVLANKIAAEKILQVFNFENP